MTTEEQFETILNRLNGLETLVYSIAGNKTKDNGPEFLTTKEAAQKTGLSIQALRCYCNRGLIRYSKPGNALLIHSDSLAEYMEKTARKTIKEQAAETLKMLRHGGAR